eukprot:m.18499 g.18499  ORF g.18499 m.18499 type:complete len:551 (+) comp5321_c0_seq1:158-1810(+)
MSDHKGANTIVSMSQLMTMMKEVARAVERGADASYADCAEWLEINGTGDITLEKTDEQGRTLLFFASYCAADSQKVFRMLLASEPSIDAINMQDVLGETALHYAVDNDNLGVTKLLIEASASPLVQCQKGMTPLHIAANKIAPHLIEVLLTERAKEEGLLSMTSKTGRTALHYFADSPEQSSTEAETMERTARMLIDAGCPASLVDNKTMTALEQFDSTSSQSRKRGHSRTLASIRGILQEAQANEAQVAAYQTYQSGENAESGRISRPRRRSSSDASNAGSKSTSTSPSRVTMSPGGAGSRNVTPAEGMQASSWRSPTGRTVPKAISPGTKTTWMSPNFQAETKITWMSPGPRVDSGTRRPEMSRAESAGGSGSKRPSPAKAANEPHRPTTSKGSPSRTSSGKGARPVQPHTAIPSRATSGGSAASVDGATSAQEASGWTEAHGAVRNTYAPSSPPKNRGEQRHSKRPRTSSGAPTPPRWAVCPLSGTIMADPVITRSGRSYERKNLEAYLERTGTEPETGMAYHNDVFYSNRGLLEIIKYWQKNCSGT